MGSTGSHPVMVNALSFWERTMPSKADPNVVNVHYGDLDGETGVIGGDFVGPGLKEHSFMVDRGAGVDTRDGTVSGREAFKEILILREGQLVAHTSQGAPNNGLKVAPNAYRDWAVLNMLEIAITHEPSGRPEQQKQGVRDYFANRANPNDKDRGR